MTDGFFSPPPDFYFEFGKCLAEIQRDPFTNALPRVVNKIAQVAPGFIVESGQAFTCVDGRERGGIWRNLPIQQDQLQGILKRLDRINVNLQEEQVAFSMSSKTMDELLMAIWNQQNKFIPFDKLGFKGVVRLDKNRPPVLRLEAPNRLVLQVTGVLDLEILVDSIDPTFTVTYVDTFVLENGKMQSKVSKSLDADLALLQAMIALGLPFELASATEIALLLIEPPGFRTPGQQLLDMFETSKFPFPLGFNLTFPVANVIVDPVTGVIFICSLTLETRQPSVRILRHSKPLLIVRSTSELDELAEQGEKIQGGFQTEALDFRDPIFTWTAEAGEIIHPDRPSTGIKFDPHTEFTHVSVQVHDADNFTRSDTIPVVVFDLERPDEKKEDPNAPLEPLDPL